ncbi:hypothetical protein GGP86_002209 [Salinibacter ruber]|nr:hypothetical protein [Salinibacter ruber]
MIARKHISAAYAFWRLSGLCAPGAASMAFE